MKRIENLAQQLRDINAAINIDTAGRAGINDCGLSAGGVNSSNRVN